MGELNAVITSYLPLQEKWKNNGQSGRVVLKLAKRSKWSDEEKLNELLPKLHGEAGEFVFDQLKNKTLSNYRKLISELDSR